MNAGHEKTNTADFLRDSRGVTHVLHVKLLTAAIWRALGFVLLVSLLAGCGMFKRGVKSEPVDESCDASCRLPCDATVPLWRPANPDAPEAWDSYPEQVTIPLKGKVEACDVQRRACVQCLDRLKAAGVTK